MTFTVPQPSFLIPAILSAVACVAWFLVVGRMTNLGLPFYIRALTFVWASAILSMGVLDFTSSYEIKNENRAVALVLLKSVIRIGIMVLAVIQYRCLGVRFLDQMRSCRFENTEGVCP